MAANQDQVETPPVIADSYWQDLSLRVAARLDRLELAGPEEDVDYLQLDDAGFGARMHRLMLMVAVGVGLYAGVTYALLNELQLPAASVQGVPAGPSPQ